MIVYRDQCDLDLNALAALRAVSSFSTLPIETLAAQVAGPRWVVTAYDDARLVGFVRAISDGVGNAYIKNVMVDPAYRRRGIGREMMRRLMTHQDGIRWVLHAREQAKAFFAAV